MTRQRWWSTTELSRIRLGIEIGKYHARFPFHLRYNEILRKAGREELSLYERGLLAGYRSGSRG